jgi:beta-glucosidase
MHTNRNVVIGLCTLASMQGGAPQQTQPFPYRNSALPVEERVHDLLGRMTADEKFWQLFMIPGDFDNPDYDYSNGVFGLQISVAPASAASAPARDVPPRDVARAHAERINRIQRYFVENTRLGIPIIPFDEAVHGLMREGATVFPQAIALAATWDSALVGQVAASIARETRSRGVRQVLSPVVNIANDVRWGRVEETYGEDPHLSSQMAVAFSREFERAGIVATPKHFVANVGEGGRDSYPIDVSARLLEELHFPPFRAAIDQGGARSVMTAYNSVDGSPATQNRALLTDKLKKEWGFRGFVISDAAATGGSTVLHHTEASSASATTHALQSGLDVIFQSSYPQYRAYQAAFRNGSIPDSVVNEAVGRVLRAKFELGLFENPYVNTDSAAYWNGLLAHRELAREAARASMVLLRNEGNTLPLSKSLRSVAVIGADAAEVRLGGYSGPGIRKVSVLDGVRGKLSAARVVHAIGAERLAPEYTVVPSEYLTTSNEGQTTRGIRGEYFDNNRLDGAARLVRHDPQINFGWTLNSPGRGIPWDWYSVRWTGRITAPSTGATRIGVEGNDGYRLLVDGRLVIDNWIKRSYGSRMAEVSFAPGSAHDIRLEYFESTGNARVKLIWDAGVRNDWRARIDSAVSVARGSDAVIVVAGIEEGEFRDRAFLKLPGHQEELIQSVAALGKPVIVVLIGGSAITMSGWMDQVEGIVHAWYPGEEGGNAVADLIFGDYNPAGRLPITFPVWEGQLPLTYNHKPTGRGDDYLDLTGQPLFPFGFGLSYTNFEYSGLRMEPAAIGADDTISVHFNLRNSGARAGDEVVQLYVRDLLTSVARPLMELKGFARVRLAPGEEREMVFQLSREQLQLLDSDMNRVVEPGRFRLMLGGSSKDIRLRGEFSVR